MSQQELVIDAVRILDAAGISYMLTGSIVSSLQGEPRFTHDIDVVVAVQPAHVKKLAKAFPSPDYYLDEEEACEAIANGSMFNVIDTNFGRKIDFWVLTDEPFDTSRFSRRYASEFLGEKVMVSAPEDTILAKLRWAKLSGGSEKQLLDALRVLEVQRERLDRDYLETWVSRLEITEYWERIKREAGE